MGASFDTLAAAARRLKKAGVEPGRAEAIAETIGAAVGADRLATKADMAGLRAEMKADISELKAEISEMKAGMYRALWLQAGGIVAAVVALVKLL